MRAISTRFFDKESGASYWSAKVFETAKCDGCADRIWISEFGIEQTSPDYATFSYTVMYEDRQGFLGDLQPTPKSNIPSIINYLLTDKFIFCKSGSVELGIHPQLISKDTLSNFHTDLSDDNRNCPIIYMVTSANGEHLLDVKELAQLVAGNAAVYYSDSPELYADINSVIGERFRCPRGGIRIYQPNINWQNCDEEYRHVFFTEERLAEMGKQKVHSILRRAICENIQNYTALELFRYNDCIDLYNASRRRTIQNLADQAKDIEFLFNDETQKLLIAKSELEKAQYDLRNTLDSYEQERQKNAALVESLNETNGLRETVASLQKNNEFLSTMANIPQSSEEIVALFLAIHGDKLAFTQRGYHSLKNCPSSNSLLWQALYSMATVLRDLYLSGESTNIIREFEENTIFSLTFTEGSMTRENNALMSLRDDYYDGRKISIEPHVSFGNFRGNKSNSIRVYYAYDAKTQKIIVGSCGDHLTNYSSKKIK
jgi:hypothetical protein